MICNNQFIEDTYHIPLRNIIYKIQDSKSITEDIRYNQEFVSSKGSYRGATPYYSEFIKTGGIYYIRLDIKCTYDIYPNSLDIYINSGHNLIGREIPTTEYKRVSYISTVPRNYNSWGGTNNSLGYYSLPNNNSYGVVKYLRNPMMLDVTYLYEYAKARGLINNAEELRTWLDTIPYHSYKDGVFSPSLENIQSTKVSLSNNSINCKQFIEYSNPTNMGWYTEVNGLDGWTTAMPNAGEGNFTFLITQRNPIQDYSIHYFNPSEHDIAIGSRYLHIATRNNTATDDNSYITTFKYKGITSSSNPFTYIILAGNSYNHYPIFNVRRVKSYKGYRMSLFIEDSVGIKDIELTHRIYNNSTNIYFMGICPQTSYDKIIKYFDAFLEHKSAKISPEGLIYTDEIDERNLIPAGSFMIDHPLPTGLYFSRDVPSGSKSLYSLAVKAASSATYLQIIRALDIKTPIEPTCRYKISCWVKSSAKHYLHTSLVFYTKGREGAYAGSDPFISQNAGGVQPGYTVKHSCYRKGTKTTLAKELKSGDTKVYLSSVSGFNPPNPPNFYGNYIGIRNTILSDYNSEGAIQYKGEINTTENSIELGYTYSGKTIPAGKYCVNCGDAYTYPYPLLTSFSSKFEADKWIYCEGYYGENKINDHYKQGGDGGTTNMEWDNNIPNDANMLTILPEVDTPTAPIYFADFRIERVYDKEDGTVSSGFGNGNVSYTNNTKVR